jgi:hypothetical protein
MKVLFQDYTFDTANNQIIFNTTDTITLEQVLVITNVKDNIIIYNFADPNKGGSINNNELSLVYDVSGMSQYSDLQIFLEIPMNPSTEETAVLLNESVVLLRRLIQLLTPIAVQDAQQRQRVVVENSTVSVSSINSLGNFNTVDAKYLLMDTARNMFANGIRQNLTY